MSEVDLALLRTASESLNRVSREVQKLRKECIDKGIELPMLNLSDDMDCGAILDAAELIEFPEGTLIKFKAGSEWEVCRGFTMDAGGLTPIGTAPDVQTGYAMLKGEGNYEESNTNQDGTEK